MNEYSKQKLNKHNKKYSQTYEPDECYSLLEDLLFTSVTYLSVPQPHGKSQNCVCEISRTWKVLENEFGSGKSRKYKCKVPGKSRNLLGNDVDADAKICASAHLHSVLELFLFAISAQHVTLMNTYSSVDAAILLCIWLVTAVCLHI